MIDAVEAARKLAFLAITYGGLASLAKPLVGGIGAILMLHRVTAYLERPLGRNRHLSITPQYLDVLIVEMKKLGYAFVTMDEAVDRLRRGRNGGQFAAITADDAYRDNLTEALPVLEYHDAPITIYVAPALTAGSVDLWWEGIEDLVEAQRPVRLSTLQGDIRLDCATPAGRDLAFRRLIEHFTRDLREDEQHSELRRLASEVGVDPSAPGRKTLMNWDEVKKIADHRLVTIGAHTVHHYNLKRLSEESVLREMCEGRRIIESEIGKRPHHFAYPYGHQDAAGRREVAFAREAGYVSAVTTRHGVLRPEHAGHLHALPRLSLNGRYQDLGSLRAMLSGATTPLANRGKRVVTV